MFVFTVSHDLKTPLTSIKIAEMLQNERVYG
jgi:K+-sensing histidine kinase KdpD